MVWYRKTEFSFEFRYPKIHLAKIFKNVFNNCKNAGLCYCFNLDNRTVGNIDWIMLWRKLNGLFPPVQAFHHRMASRVKSSDNKYTEYSEQNLCWQINKVCVQHLIIRRQDRQSVYGVTSWRVWEIFQIFGWHNITDTTSIANRD
jgi:hypothetical protein